MIKILFSEMRPTLGFLLVGMLLAPPPPSLDGVLRGLNLQQYSQLMEEQEIDLPILAQLSEEQLARIIFIIKNISKLSEKDLTIDFGLLEYSSLFLGRLWKLNVFL